MWRGNWSFSSQPITQGYRWQPATSSKKKTTIWYNPNPRDRGKKVDKGVYLLQLFFLTFNHISHWESQLFYIFQIIIPIPIFLMARRSKHQMGDLAHDKSPAVEGSMTVWCTRSQSCDYTKEQTLDSSREAGGTGRSEGTVLCWHEDGFDGTRTFERHKKLPLHTFWVVEILGWHRISNQEMAFGGQKTALSEPSYQKSSKDRRDTRVSSLNGTNGAQEKWDNNHGVT